MSVFPPIKHLITHLPILGECGLSDENGVSGRRAVFLSVHGGGGKSEGPLNLGVLLGFTVPLTTSGNFNIVFVVPDYMKYITCYHVHCCL